MLRYIISCKRTLLVCSSRKLEPDYFSIKIVFIAYFLPICLIILYESYNLCSKYMFYIYMFSVIIKLHSVYNIYMDGVYTYMDAHRYTTSPSKIVFTCVPRSRYWAKNCEQVACDECAVRKNPKGMGRETTPRSQQGCDFNNDLWGAASAWTLDGTLSSPKSLS